MKIGILEPVSFSPQAIKELKKLGEVTCFKNNLDEFLLDKEVLFIRLDYDLDKDFLKKAPGLKFICTPTTGLNHLDLEAVKKKGITILSLKGETDFLENIRATPEHSFGLAIALLRNYKEAFLTSTNCEWDRTKFFGEELFRNKVGIIGFGRVGKIIAKYSQVFDSKVHYYDIKDDVVPKFGASKVSSIPELIKKTNVIFLSASYYSNSSPIVGRKELKLMKNKYFINTARGELLDEDYLLKLISLGHFKGVAVDVIANETKTNKLNDFLSLANAHNLIITPHIGGASYTSLNRTEEFIVEKLKKVIKAKQ